jgi:hypothetical protein
MAGYSPTPLAKKLGIVEGSVLVLASAPDAFELELPPGVVVRRQLQGRADVVVAFVTSSNRLDQRLEKLAAAVFPAGGLWIAWPKKSSGVPTDVTDHVVRSLAIPLGLVDNKVCAIDETWTGLRLVWRRENRTGP